MHGSAAGALKLALIVLTAALAQCARSHPTSFDEFRAWAEENGKSYLHDEQELARRYSIWSDNVERIQRLNRQRAGPRTALRSSSSSMRLGLTAHTDLTREEFRARYLGAPMQPRTFTPLSRSLKTAGSDTSPYAVLSKAWSRLASAAGFGSHVRSRANVMAEEHWRFENVTPPATVDWRTAQPAVLGPIKDQHVNGTPCGSCWAFSSVSIMEVASAMATGAVVTGSEQQLIDCDKKYDHGCSGGGWLNAIQYTINNKGLTTDLKYPYIGKDGICNEELEQQQHHELQVSSWEDVQFHNETALMAAVSKTPVIVAICVGPALDDWHHYTGGVYDAPCCEDKSQVTLDHGIVVVGYGEEDGVPYWVLKNSWGTHWGENGFMRIRRFHGESGKCALASFPAMVFRKPYPEAFTPAGPTEQLAVV